MKTNVNFVCLLLAVGSFACISNAQKESHADLAKSNEPNEPDNEEQASKSVRSEDLNDDYLTKIVDDKSTSAPESAESKAEKFKIESLIRSIEQESNDDYKYSLTWLPALNNRQEAEDDGRLFQVAISPKEKYVCISPKVMSRENKLRQLLFDNRDVNPFTLIQSQIKTDECVMRREHYWTYMICHGLQITQFHESPNDLNQKKSDMKVFVLGEFKRSELNRAESEFLNKIKLLGTKHEVPFPTVPVKGLDMLYLEWSMTDGNICDLNQKPRTTLVKYVCSTSDTVEFLSMKEVATCQYEALVALPQLCKHPAFSVSDVSQIECAPDSLDAGQYPTNYFKYHAMSPKLNLETILNKKRFYFADLDMKNNLNLAMKSFSVQELEDETYVVKVIGNEDAHALNKPDSKKDSIEQQLNENIFQSFLDGEMCFTGGSGWWKYEFCYGKHVKQYHEEDGKRGVTILLGSWNAEKHKEHLSQNPKKQQTPGPDRDHVIHHYSQGDSCENGPRKTDVKLKCMKSSSQLGSEAVQLYLIESKMCEYTLVFISPSVCDLIKDADEFGFVEGKLPYTIKT